MRVLQLTRDDFLENYFDWQPGEHVNLIEPTGGGKSHLLYQLLGRAMAQNPGLSVVSLMPKPIDPTTEQWKRQLKFGETDRWPPERWPWQSAPPGYILWPKHIPDDEDRNREHLAGRFKECFNRQYWQGHSITVADDAYLLGLMYGCNSELDRHWTAGRSAGSSLWTTLQKPSGTMAGSVSSFAYDAPTHLFLGRDTDERNLKRFQEISGVDSVEVAEVVRHLPVHRIRNAAVSEKLYIDKRGPYMCQVGV